MYYNVQIYSWKLKPFLWVWDFGFYRLGLSDRWHSLRHPALPGRRVYIILQIMSSVSLYIDPVQVIIILAARSLESVLFRPLSWCSHLEFSTLTSVLPNRDWKSKMVWFLFRKMIISIHLCYSIQGTWPRLRRHDKGTLCYTVHWAFWRRGVYSRTIFSKWPQMKLVQGVNFRLDWSLVVIRFVLVDVNTFDLTVNLEKAIWNGARSKVIMNAGSTEARFWRNLRASKCDVILCSGQFRAWA